MKYCEKCKIVCGRHFCPVCGSEKLREAENDDFCFLAELNSLSGEMLEESLKSENIPCAAVPYGNGVRSAFGLNLENYKIYVPFGFLERASEILKYFSNDFDEDRRNELIGNIDKLNADQCTQKKIKKNLKLTEEENVFEYCKQKIINAKKIVDEGQITGCVKGGHYLFVYTGNEIMVINSATYEILSVKTDKRK